MVSIFVSFSRLKDAELRFFCIASISCHSLIYFSYDFTHWAECMGKYLTSIVEVRDAERCFMSAHKCYMQWGAVAKADKLWKDWGLSSSAECIEISTIKHKRDE